MKITEELDTEKEKEIAKQDAEKKTLVELIESYDNKPLIAETASNTESYDCNSEVKPISGITEEGDLIIDHDRKLAFDKPKTPNINIANSTATKIVEDVIIKNPKPLRRIVITEMNDIKAETRDEPADGENKGESDEAKASGKENEKTKEEEKETEEDDVTVASISGATVTNFMQQCGRIYSI